MKSRLIIAGVLLTLPLAAWAMPINGELEISGSGEGTCGDPPVGCSLDVADGLSFLLPNANTFLVVDSTGDFDDGTIGFGSQGTINDFMFSDIPPGVALWSIAGTNGTFSFFLDTLNIVSQGLAFGDAFLNLAGSGTISSTDPNLDDTLGIWTLSADDSTPNTFTFAWSSTTVASEPSILLVFGIGLLGLAAGRRFRR